MSGKQEASVGPSPGQGTRDNPRWLPAEQRGRQLQLRGLLQNAFATLCLPHHGFGGSSVSRAAHQDTASLIPVQSAVYPDVAKGEREETHTLQSPGVYVGNQN